MALPQPESTEEDEKEEEKEGEREDTQNLSTVVEEETRMTQNRAADDQGRLQALYVSRRRTGLNSFITSLR